MSTTPDGDKSSPVGGASKMQGTGSSSATTTGSGGGMGVAGSTTGGGGSGPGSAGGPPQGTATGTPTAYPIDLASASKVLVRPTTEKTTNMPTTYRIGNSAGNQMRVVIPSNAASQTFYRHSINLKSDPSSNRAQITALPPRTQTSITVSRPQTPTTYHVPTRVPTTVANIQGPRATITAPIRIPTPPISVANINTYVRQSVPSRTSSPSSATIISQGQTWMSNVQVQVPTQLIRANSITQPPRARVVAQTISANQSSANVNNATITANVVAHPATTQANQQNVSLSGTNPSQAFVATLATAVLPPQQRQLSTLVYTNNSSQQPYSSGTNPQRLTLATTLSPQRPTGVRPIQQRLPTTNLGVRVTAGSISIRTPSVPVLAPTTVLTTIASGTLGGTQQNRNPAVVSTANISNTIPARIIQVQNPQSGQIISGGRLSTNLVNIQPLLVNNRIPHSNLTIAQVGKLTPVAASQVQNSSGSTTTSQHDSGGGSGGGATTTLQTASGQQIVVSSGQVSGGSTIITGNLLSNQSGSGGTGQPQTQGQITQIVNVNPGSMGSALSGGQTPQIVTVSQGQVIGTPQTISVSNSGGSGSTTVIPIPLAITGGRSTTAIPVSVATLSGGQNPISIVSGGSTITGIVRTTTSGLGGSGGGSGLSSSTMPSILPIAKVTPQQLSSLSTIEAVSSSSSPYSVSGTGTSLYIQTRPQQPSAIVTTVASTGKSSSTLNVVSGGNTGSSSATIFPASTLYYERVTPSPASSSQPVTSSGGSGAIALVQSASSLTSTTITTASAISGPVFSISSSALSSAPTGGGSVGGGSTTLVSGVTSSQLSSSNVITTTVSSSLPYSSTAGSFAIVQQASSGRNLSSGPIHGIVSSSTATSGAAGGGQFQSQSQQPLSQSQQSTSQQIPVRFHPQLLVDGGQAQQIIMTGSSTSSGQQQQQQQQQPSHMLIPVNPGGKIESPQSSILRKRGVSPTIKMGKDLTQTLIAMGKERARESEQRERERERELSPPSRPASTDGSTTVSATSSPGADQQEQEEIKAMAFANRNANSDLPFKLGNEEGFLHGSQPPNQDPQALGHPFHHGSLPHQNSIAGSSNGGNYEQSPRKKPRKQNVSEGLKSVANSLQFFANNELDSSYRMDTSGPTNLATAAATVTAAAAIVEAGFLSQQQQQQQLQQQQSHLSAKAMPNSNAVLNNLVGAAASAVKHDSQLSQGSTTSATKDGTVAPPVAKDTSSIATSRKPRNVSILESYKQSWKAANNHFQRYTDVKQREERRPTMVDIANQSHVLQKVNGWKIYHLSAQIEDLCELESQAYDKLDQMLKTMEATPKPSAEIERINELLKGNMQRSKIIIDGINEARTQIMKIFDHKTHVSDIIQRCASKRNFKKREKS